MTRRKRKIDAQKLIGKWVLKDKVTKEEEKGYILVGIEFRKDGKMKLNAKQGGVISRGNILTSTTKRSKWSYRKPLSNT